MINKKILTLCLVCNHPKILLGMKKKGFGVGRWNGFGGKVEVGETVEDAARRELKEESGLDALNITKRGIVEFEFENDPKILEVHIFNVEKINGEPKESDEMRPQWFDIDKIPYKQMWTDDAHWMPIFLKGKKFRGKFLFDRPSNTEYASKILSKNICEVEEI